MTNAELYKKLSSAEGMRYPYDNGRNFFADLAGSVGTDMAKDMAKTYIDLMEEFPQSDSEMDFIRQVRMAVREAQ